MTETRTYALTGYGGQPTVATVTVRSFDRPARVRRAVKGLGACWAAALASVLIPVAHFVLVPSLLLYGAYTFWERLGTQAIATAAEGTCPDCGRAQQLETGGRWHVPRDIVCRYCQRSLHIS
ncbi:MAG: hypothetical protein ACREME_00085 [Gemmatimonadales bacterium]